MAASITANAPRAPPPYTPRAGPGRFIPLRVQSPRRLECRQPGAVERHSTPPERLEGGSVRGERLPNATREDARFAARPNALSPIPINRMQWCSRPGQKPSPRLSLAATLAEEQPLASTRTFSKRRLGVPVRRIVVSEHGERSNHRHPPDRPWARGPWICCCVSARVEYRPARFFP